jgi:hypothetical protein
MGGDGEGERSWTDEEQRSLDAALASTLATPSSGGSAVEEKKAATERWKLIGQKVGIPARECLARYKSLRKALQVVGSSRSACVIVCARACACGCQGSVLSA